MTNKKINMFEILEHLEKWKHDDIRTLSMVLSLLEKMDIKIDKETEENE